MLKITKAEFIKSASSPVEYPKGALPEFAFFGRSNCGKSSLINMIVGRKALVKTSSMPGMTRLVNFFAVNDSFILADLPGYGFARRSASERAGFDKMLASYVKTRNTLKVIFFLMDCRRPPDAPEKDSVAYFLSSGRSVSLIATKADKLNMAERSKAARLFESSFGEQAGKVIFTSATKKTGREELLKEIEERL